MHHHLDAYAYTNRLKHLPPQQKLLFALITLLLALVAHPVTQGVIFLWLSGWTLGYARIPVKVYGRLLVVIMLFLLASLPALVLEVVPVNQLASVQFPASGGLVLGNWYLWVSNPGLTRAVAVGMRSLACVSCLLFMVLTVPFADLLRVLRQGRVPVVLLDILQLMYRFIFLFLDVATQLQLAQQARGGYRTRRRWLQSVALLVGQLVVRSLHRYQQFSLGLAARGFKGEFQVDATRPYRFSPRYAWESLLGCIGLVFLNSRL